MSVEYKVTTADGSTASIPSAKVVNDLRAIGVDATLTPDARNVNYVIDGQAMTMPVTELIASTVGPVAGIAFTPDGTDFSGVDSSLRLGIENFPNDRLRQKYLELTLESRGIENPVIYGQGSDWALFDPQTGKYKALTNKPGVDMSDIGMIGAEGARIAGSILGGAAGATAGAGAGPVGLLAGGALGSGVGGQVGRGLVDAYLAATEPGYRELVSNLGSEELKDIALQRSGQFGMDVAGGTLAGGLGLVPQLSKGLVTRAGSALSGGLEKAGAITRSAAGAAARSDIAKALGPELVAGAGPVQLGALLAQAPAAGARRIPTAGAWIANKLGRPDLAEELAGIGAQQAARGPSSGLDRMIRNWQTRIGGEPFQRAIPQGPRTAADVLEDLGQRAGTRLENWAKARGARRATAAENAMASDIGGTGIGARRAAPFTTEGYETAAKNLVAEESLPQYFGAAGRNLGAISEGLGAAGRGVLGGIEGSAGIGYRGLQGLGAGLEKVGQAGKLGFGLAQPLEYRLGAAAAGRFAEDQLYGGM